MKKVYRNKIMIGFVLTFAIQAFSRARVVYALFHDTSAPLRTLHSVTSKRKMSIYPFHKDPSFFNQEGLEDPVIQNYFFNSLPPSTVFNFEGMGQGFKGPSGAFEIDGAPPDAIGAVGTNHYFQQVNSSIAIFTKAGVPLYGPVKTNTLWKDFGNQCEKTEDGQGNVLYDHLANRWIISQVVVTNKPYFECIAISSSEDPLGSYHRYSFPYAYMPDLPKIGLWHDAYYQTTNMFNDDESFDHSTICALNRHAMLKGLPASQQCIDLTTHDSNLIPASIVGENSPPSGSPHFLLSLEVNHLHFWKFYLDWMRSDKTQLIGPMNLAVAPFVPACGSKICIPQLNSQQKLDPLGDRLMRRLVYRNFGDHESLVVAHSVNAGSSTGIRWYEIRDPDAKKLNIYQQGTYAPDSSYRWLGSAAIDKAGGIALGFSVSSKTIHPGIRFTGRNASDPLGTMGLGEGIVINGKGSQQLGLERWGDYSSLTLDPLDDCTFYLTSEYLVRDGIFNWHTRVGAFQLPGCTHGTTKSAE